MPVALGDQIYLRTAIASVCTAKRDQWFSPAPANSFPDEYAVLGLLQPNKANGHAALAALGALYSSPTEKMATTARSQAGQGGWHFQGP